MDFGRRSGTRPDWTADKDTVAKFVDSIINNADWRSAYLKDVVANFQSSVGSRSSLMHVGDSSAVVIRVVDVNTESALRVANNVARSIDVRPAQSSLGLKSNIIDLSSPTVVESSRFSASHDRSTLVVDFAPTNVVTMGPLCESTAKK